MKCPVVAIRLSVKNYGLGSWNIHKGRLQAIWIWMEQITAGFSVNHQNYRGIVVFIHMIQIDAVGKSAKQKCNCNKISKNYWS